MAASIKRHASGLGTFVSHVNPVTGKKDWIMQDENYDFHQEIARSAYADMLHDTERNEKYYSALKKVIRRLKEQGKRADVLDIGTGTGLLSMMAASAGADTVTACEAFRPMAKCAQRIIHQNGLSDKIRLVAKRSTEMTVGADGDMPQRANVLVTEVFDTELIGEGAVNTFNHAHTHLLQADCSVIPHAANLYAQPVHSNLIRRWNQINTSQTNVVIPPDVSKCGGALSLHDLQLDQLCSRFTPLSAPQQVFRFDFAGDKRLDKNRRKDTTLEAINAGTVDAVFMWWDCEMDWEGEITLSCAPRWAHPDGPTLPWRDHWMQAVYYPSTPLHVATGDSFTLVSCHDEYSLWFDVADTQSGSVSVSERPMCTCGFKTILSRSRIGMMGDPHRMDVLQKILKKHVTDSSICVVISDASLLTIMAAKMAAKVYVLETDAMHRRITESLIKENSVENKVTIIDKDPDSLTAADFHNNKPTVVLGEPYFASAYLPWHHLHLMYAATSLGSLLAPTAPVLPGTMVVWALAMDFDHLWKIRAPVGICEGFDISEFDNLIESSSGISDENVEPQPLWEYPGVAVSKPIKVIQLQHSSLQKVQNTTVDISIQRSGQVNGVALWTEWQFEDDLSVSTGPRSDVVVGKYPFWDMYTRQGLHLLPKPVSRNSGDVISITTKFTPQDGELNFTFTV